MSGEVVLKLSIVVFTSIITLKALDFGLELIGYIGSEVEKF